MRWPQITSTAIAVLLTAASATAATDGEHRGEADDHAAAAADSVSFREALAPYGVWMELPRLGEVWEPDAVPAGWRPYTEGRWLYTDDGWTWASDFDWGWAPFHYGRWAHDPVWGWVWVPGDVWGPAWVSWRSGDGFVGWAPLPPDAAWLPDRGFAAEFDFDSIPPDWWVFVDPDDFVRPIAPAHIFNFERERAFLHRSRAEARLAYEGGRLIDRGVDVDHIEHVLGRPVHRYRLADGDGPRARVEGSAVHLYRPALRPLDRDRHAPFATDEGRVAAAREHAEQQRQLVDRQRSEQLRLEQRQAEERQQMLHSYNRRLVRHSALDQQQLAQREAAEEHWRAAHRASGQPAARER